MTGRHPQSVGLYPGVLFADSLKGHCVHDGDFQIYFDGDILELCRE